MEYVNSRTKKDKRITIFVDERIEDVRKKIEENTGVNATYVQTFDFLIHYYLKDVNND
jgi:chorismate mutase